ncbi:protein DETOXIFICATION 17 isoform X2 [Selaginella moellendorffii]|uniref:protein DETOXIFICATION 17 isoform X2 n=1 Tax=Selaginella moellendorffii TaxID=88036 RepID=UPI000D1C7C28|nr:protein DETOXIFICATION 17 isoform X2 [Selaginella moellendorffii]|eukprot:XP_024515552.1 protein DETOXIFICATION 17 isoform X2 [Selaginella moellendorffii]
MALEDLRRPLANAAGERSQEQQQDDHACSRGVQAGPWMDNVNEMKRVCGLSAPNMAVNLFDMGIVLVSLLFVGRIGELELAGASLAITMANSLGYFVLMGMAGALETLCGQAYGAKAYHMLGIYLQQAVALSVILCIPLSTLFIFTRRILLLLGQDPAMSAKAKDFIVWLIPSLFANAFVQPLLKFLQTQGVVIPSAIFSAVSFGAHILLSWLFIHKFHVGFHSVAISTSISFWIKAALLALYVCCSKVCKHTWRGFSTCVCTNVNHFLKLSLVSAFMVCLEYWTFEMLVLLAGLLPNPQIEVSTLSICNSMATFNYMITLGLSLGVSIRVSNELGARNPSAAKLAVFVVLVLATAEVFIAAAFLLMVHKSWGWVFTNESEVVGNLTSITPFLALWILIDGTQCVLQDLSLPVQVWCVDAVAKTWALSSTWQPFTSAAFQWECFWDSPSSLKPRGSWLGQQWDSSSSSCSTSFLYFAWTGEGRL